MQPVTSKVLFFFVHPSKFYLFRETIRRLKQAGVDVEIAIVAKDVLEDLIKSEGWEYTNLIPGGRRSSRLKGLWGAAYFSMLTLSKLWQHTRGKNYSLFLTDDLLTIIGRLKKVPSLLFVDDDYDVVKEALPLYITANTVVAPHCTRLGQFVSKKFGYYGYHELAYLTPQTFTPDREKIRQFHKDDSKYYLLRLVSLTATHDRGKQGISDQVINRLLPLLERHGKVYISSERPLPEELEKYRIRIAPRDIAHALYYAEMFIGDSQTMTSEAAILGTPALRFNDFVGRISSMEEKETKYQITFGFKTDQFEQLYTKAEELLKTPNLKEVWQQRRERLLRDCEDVNDVIMRAIQLYLPLPEATSYVPQAQGL